MPINQSSSYQPNNFDLIRLLAALQVMITNHYNSHFGMGISCSLWGAFAGVPIFLLLTGFFIPMSFEHNSKTKEFLFNRLLKIIPGMWFSIILGVLLMFLAGYDIHASFKSFIIWLTSYLIYPLYTPEYLRGYGVGAMNGSLWVIPIQLTFYLMIPFLYNFFNFRKNANLKIITLFIFFVATKFVIEYAFQRMGLAGTPAHKVFTSSIFVHFPMLCIGMIAYKNFDILIKIVKNRFLIFLAIHLGLYYTFYGIGMEYSCLDTSNSWTKWPLIATLSLCIFSGAYTLPNLSYKILRRYDLSYHLYVNHMPVGNFILFTLGIGFFNAILSTIIVVFVSILSKKIHNRSFHKDEKERIEKMLVYCS